MLSLRRNSSSLSKQAIEAAALAVQGGGSRPCPPQAPIVEGWCAASRARTHRAGTRRRRSRGCGCCSSGLNGVQLPRADATAAESDGARRSHPLGLGPADALKAMRGGEDARAAFCVAVERRRGLPAEVLVAHRWALSSGVLVGRVLEALPGRAQSLRRADSGQVESAMALLQLWASPELGCFGGDPDAAAALSAAAAAAAPELQRRLLEIVDVASSRRTDSAVVERLFDGAEREWQCLSLADIDATGLAHQLAALDCQLYAEVGVEELRVQTCSPDEAALKAPHLQRIVQHGNSVSTWLAVRRRARVPAERGHRRSLS